LSKLLLLYKVNYTLVLCGKDQFHFSTMFFQKWHISTMFNSSLALRYLKLFFCYLLMKKARAVYVSGQKYEIHHPKLIFHYSASKKHDSVCTWRQRILCFFFSGWIWNLSLGGNFRIFDHVCELHVLFPVKK